MFANSGSGDMVGIAAVASLPLEFRSPSQCSKGLCLRYCSIGQRDLQRRDSCNLRRNTGHLQMDVGNRSEPELHASNKNTGPASTAIWYLNNNAFVARTGAPTLPVGWIVVGVADFNGDSQPDYLLYNVSTTKQGFGI